MKAKCGQKRCSKCGQTKPVADFNRDAGRNDGLYLWCRECDNETKRRRYREVVKPRREGRA